MTIYRPYGRKVGSNAASQVQGPRFDRELKLLSLCSFAMLFPCHSEFPLGPLVSHHQTKMVGGLARLVSYTMTIKQP